MTYLLLGSGKLARHFDHYFKILGLNYLKWARKPDSNFNSISTNIYPDAGERLKQAARQATHILFLLKDQNIEEFYETYREYFEGKNLFHCSGALVSPNLKTAHPLMTFGDDLYVTEDYLNFPFITELSAEEFRTHFPGLPNQVFQLPSELQSLYHAYCVVSGNFTQILWQEIKKRFELELKMPAEALDPYLQRVCANLVLNPNGALTGPLGRSDVKTLQANLEALENDALKGVYEAFLNFKNIKI